MTPAVVELEAGVGSVGQHRARLGAVCIACGAGTDGAAYCAGCAELIEVYEELYASEFWRTLHDRE